MIVIQKGDLHRNVPVLAQIELIAKKSISVKVICTDCDEKTYQKLILLGVEVYMTRHWVFNFFILRKISDWLMFRRNAIKKLKSISESNEKIIIGSVDTALAIGNYLKNYNFALNIRELYDKYPLYLFAIKSIAQSASDVIVPEFSRANILKNWLSLEKLPRVIPNKPISHPLKRNLFITNQDARNIIDQLHNKKILIYQGLIDEDRSLLEVAKALRLLNNMEFVLLVMGKENDNIITSLKNEYKNTYHINYIPAPFHLEVTSHAYIGITNYDDSSLNNLFCAPNKIYEYSGFGIPILARDIPGLRYTVGMHNVGRCIRFDNIEDIAEAINDIDKNYIKFTNNSADFFHSVDLNSLYDFLFEE